MARGRELAVGGAAPKGKFLTVSVSGGRSASAPTGWQGARFDTLSSVLYRARIRPNYLERIWVYDQVTTRLKYPTHWKFHHCFLGIKGGKFWPGIGKGICHPGVHTPIQCSQEPLLSPTHTHAHRVMGEQPLHQVVAVHVTHKVYKTALLVQTRRLGRCLRLCVPLITDTQRLLQQHDDDAACHPLHNSLRVTSFNSCPNIHESLPPILFK